MRQAKVVVVNPQLIDNEGNTVGSAEVSSRGEALQAKNIKYRPPSIRDTLSINNAIDEYATRQGTQQRKIDSERMTTGNSNDPNSP
jgi:hypothetical protein